MRTVIAAVVLLVAGRLRAEQVTFALVVDYPLLEATLARQLRAERDGSALLWGTRGGCRFLTLDHLQIEPAEGRVRLTARGGARVGLGFLGLCLVPVSWQGRIDTLATPELGSDWQLRFRDLDSHLSDAEGRRTAVASRLWDLVKGRVEEAWRGFSLDLGPPVDEARALLRASAEPSRAAPVLAALDSLRPVGVAASAEGIEARVALDLPPPASGAAGPEPALEPMEVARWQAALESWDGFLAFVIKDLGAIDADAHVRDELLTLLLSSRHRLLAALASGPEAGVDPVRQLFLDAWDQLRAIVPETASPGALEDRALRYIAFLAAGDALAGLDAAGPSLGLEISADGLRRLARVLEPEFAGDPIAYSEMPDEALRRLFRFHDPALVLPENEAAPPDASWWRLGPRPAGAEPPPGDELSALGRRLDRWVPRPDELQTYRDVVGRLLATIAERSGRTNAIEERFVALYHHLVPATAWQESCWRQFVEREGRVTYLLSSTGDVGVMQVNRRVWRGFFDLGRLEWDIAYNVGAGAEILAQLLTRYGSREAASKLENAARATYAAYNGGPDAYRRYRLGRIPRRQRAVDRAFWEKYQAMAEGRALDFVLCTESWGKTASARLSTGAVGSTPKWCMSSRSSSATVTISARHASIASRPRASFV